MCMAQPFYQYSYFISRGEIMNIVLNLILFFKTMFVLVEMMFK